MEMPDEKPTNLYPNLEPLQPSAPLTSFVEPHLANIYIVALMGQKPNHSGYIGSIRFNSY